MTDLIISPVFTVAIDVTLLLAQTQQYRRIRCVSKTGAILQVDARVCAEAGRVAASPGRVPGAVARMSSITPFASGSDTTRNACTETSSHTRKVWQMVSFSFNFFFQFFFLPEIQAPGS